MSITINGTGSITGLTAGGLPDGSITADDIASGAVTAAKLASGLVLKVQQFNDVGSNTSSTSYTNANAILFSYTPVSTSSQLILTATFNAQIGNVASTNAQSFHTIGEFGGALGSGYLHRAFSGSGGIGLQTMGCIQVAVPNTSTTTRYFQMLHAVNGAGQTSTTAAIYMTVMEVAV